MLYYNDYDYDDFAELRRKTARRARTIDRNGGSEAMRTNIQDPIVTFIQFL